MLTFPYQAEPFAGQAPPSLPAGSTCRWRPLVPVTISGLTGAQYLPQALLDPGADDTVFPLDLAILLGIPLLPPTGHGVRWRGQGYAMQFGEAELELVDDTGATLTWRATIGFSPAPIRYPLLGVCGCLEFLDANFRGADHLIELETNASYPGTVS